MPESPSPSVPASEQEPTGKFCLGCGYALEGLPTELCPECGRRFDPNDAETYALFPASPVLHRAILWSIGWPIFAVAGVATVLTLVSRAMPGGIFPIDMFALLIWLGLAATWSVQSIGLTAMWMQKTRRTPRARIRPRIRRMAVLPALVITLAVLLSARVPFRVSFLISRTAMDDLAQSVLSAPEGTQFSDRRVGVYPATGIERCPGGVRFTIRHSGFLDGYGFARFDAGPPPSTWDESYVPLSGRWYIWHWRF